MKRIGKNETTEMAPVKKCFVALETALYLLFLALDAFSTGGGDGVKYLTIVVCLLAGILLSLVFLFLMGKVRGSVYLTNVGETCNKGCQSAVSAIMNTAAAVGFGSVVKITPGFAFLSELVLGIGGSPLIAESIAINVLAGATGSASGGLQIALDALADNFIQMSQTSGIPLAVFHRVGSIACGGLNTMPHDGAVVTYLSYCKKRKRRASRTRMLKRRMIKLLEKLLSQRDGIHSEYGALLRYTQDYHKRLSTIRKVLVQEKEMFEGRKVSDRIVSIDRHYVRPIVRGKENQVRRVWCKGQ